MAAHDQRTWPRINYPVRRDFVETSRIPPSSQNPAPRANDSDQDEPDPRLFVGSMEKGMRVLELFNEHPMPLSIGDIAEKTLMGRSAAQRYVYTLHQLGYLNKDAESKKYFPALKLIGLVRGLHRHRSQRDLAYPLLQALAAETLETVSWVELDGDDVVVSSLNWTSGSADPDHPWNDVGVHLHAPSIALHALAKLDSFFPTQLADARGGSAVKD